MLALSNGLRQLRHYACVDNLGALGEDPESVASVPRQVIAIFESFGLAVHAEEVLDVELDGQSSGRC